MSNRLEFAASFISADTIGIEIGVWKGDFSAQIINRLRPSTLHLVDPWSFKEDYKHAWYGPKGAGSQDEMDLIFRQVNARFNSEISQGKVQIHRGSIQESTITKADWAYIDGDHNYQAVINDISFCRNLIGDSGILIFDDYNSNGWWKDGVTRAVHESVERGQLNILEIYKNQCSTKITF